MAPLSNYTTSLNESFNAITFRNTPTILQLHYNTMRFGSPNEIAFAILQPPQDSASTQSQSTLYNNQLVPITNNYRVSYLIGASSWSVIIASAFLAWIIIIIICIIIDRKKPIFILSGGSTPSKNRNRCLPSKKDGTRMVSPALSPMSTNLDEETSYLENDDDIETMKITDEFPQNDDYPQSREDRLSIIPVPLSSMYTTNVPHGRDDSSHLHHGLDGCDVESPQKVVGARKCPVGGSIGFIRSVVLFCGVGTIISSIFFVTNGVGLVTTGLRDVKSSLNVAQDTIERASIILNDLVQSDLVMILRSLREYYEECAKVNILDMIPFQLDHIQRSQDSSAPVIVSQFIKPQLEETLLDIPAIGASTQYALKMTKSVIIDIQSMIQSMTSLVQLSSITYAALLIAIVASIMIIVIQASRKRLTSIHFRAHMCFLHPFFGVLVALSWFLGCVFILVSVVMADFCIDSPDSRVKYLLQTSHEIDQTLYEFLDFYISDCGTGHVTFSDDVLGPRYFHETIGEALTGINDAHHNLEQLMAQGQCTNTSTHDQLHGLITMLDDANNITSCTTWNPIYTRIAYNAMCYTFVEGFVWIFSTQMAIALLCMTIITLPVALRIF